MRRLPTVVGLTPTQDEIRYGEWLAGAGLPEGATVALRAWVGDAAAHADRIASEPKARGRATKGEIGETIPSLPTPSAPVSRVRVQLTAYEGGKYAAKPVGDTTETNFTVRGMPGAEVAALLAGLRGLFVAREAARVRARSHAPQARRSPTEVGRASGDEAEGWRGDGTLRVPSRRVRVQITEYAKGFAGYVKAEGRGAAFNVSLPGAELGEASAMVGACLGPGGSVVAKNLSVFEELLRRIGDAPQELFSPPAQGGAGWGSPTTPDFQPNAVRKTLRVESTEHTEHTEHTRSIHMSAVADPHEDEILDAMAGHPYPAITPERNPSGSEGATLAPAPTLVPSPFPTLPSVAGLSPKTCRCCGTSHDSKSWASLKWVGHMGEGEDRILLRNCACGSTLSIPDPAALPPRENLYRPAWDAVADVADLMLLPESRSILEATDAWIAGKGSMALVDQALGLSSDASALNAPSSPADLAAWLLAAEILGGEAPDASVKTAHEAA